MCNNGEHLAQAFYHRRCEGEIWEEVEVEENHMNWKGRLVYKPHQDCCRDIVGGVRQLGGYGSRLVWEPVDSFDQYVEEVLRAV